MADGRSRPPTDGESNPMLEARPDVRGGAVETEPVAEAGLARQRGDGGGAGVGAGDYLRAGDASAVVAGRGSGAG